MQEELQDGFTTDVAAITDIQMAQTTFWADREQSKGIELCRTKILGISTVCGGGLGRDIPDGLIRTVEVTSGDKLQVVESDIHGEKAVG